MNEAETRTTSGNSVLPFRGGRMLKIFLNQLDVGNDVALSLLYLDYPCFSFVKLRWHQCVPWLINECARVT